MIHHVETWLKSKPRKSEIVEIQNGKDKVKIIPQKIIESLLDELTEQNWSTKNFQFSRWDETYEEFSTAAPGQLYIPVKKIRTVCDASLELVVTYRMVVPLSPYETAPTVAGSVYKEIEITRTLVGAYSFDTSLFGNDHIANTAKSLCISNAASDLGRRFGKDLNPKEASMMLLGMKQPIKIDAPTVSEEGKGKIAESLDKIKGDLSKKIIG